MIKDELDIPQSDPSVICNVFKRFYEKLFEDDYWQDILEGLEDSIHDFIPTQIDPEYSHYLDRRLTLHELENALFSMAPYKTQGSDGLPMEFY